MQEQLLDLNEQEVYLALAHNPNLKESVLEKLLKDSNDLIESALYENLAMPVNMLEDAYKEGRFYESLAKNENTPVEILYQLQLDSRYERYVKTNKAFAKHIQSENIGWLI
jgi:hypothetical protein